MNQLGRLILWRCWTNCRLWEGWKPLISVVHTLLKQQKSSEPENLGHLCLQSRELPGRFGAQDPGKAKGKQARGLTWNHQLHTASSIWQIPVSRLGPLSGCSCLPAEAWSAQGCVKLCSDTLNTDGMDHAGLILCSFLYGRCAAAPSVKKHMCFAVVPSWPDNDFQSLVSQNIKHGPLNGLSLPV